ncbi:hypothetical protein CL630_00140 [bacterium]|nr:hypothetical protein [bacterium]|tara:strand:+ start:15294 stop:16289 length:996 start_codon:yes stop_codon:yes gene_type:complete
MEKNFDFIAIGDITTDAFIRLSGDDATVQKDDHKKINLCLNFGDKIEYDSVTEVSAVGNSPNAAVSAHRLGLNSALITNLGNDYHGKNCVAQLEKQNVATDFVKIHEGKESNYHYVLWYEEERTILVKHHEYPYEMPDAGTPKWFYLSSLGENSIPFHADIASYIKKNPDIKLSFQPGTFQMRLGHETLKGVYEVSELFFCNVQEAQRILKTEEKDIKKLLSGMHDLGPRIVVITDGPDGAYTYDGSEFWHMPMYPDPAPPLDRTGAGDSFASTFTAMLALGKSIPDALLHAPVNSMSVVQKVGAQEGLLTLDEIEDWLKKAPEDYKPKKY